MRATLSRHAQAFLTKYICLFEENFFSCLRINFLFVIEIRQMQIFSNSSRKKKFTKIEYPDSVVGHCHGTLRVAILASKYDRPNPSSLSDMMFSMIFSKIVKSHTFKKIAKKL